VSLLDHHVEFLAALRAGRAAGVGRGGAGCGRRDPGDAADRPRGDARGVRHDPRQEAGRPARVRHDLRPYYPAVVGAMGSGPGGAEPQRPAPLPWEVNDADRLAAARRVARVPAQWRPAGGCGDRPRRRRQPRHADRDGKRARHVVADDGDGPARTADPAARTAAAVLGRAGVRRDGRARRPRERSMRGWRSSAGSSTPMCSGAWRRRPMPSRSPGQPHAPASTGWPSSARPGSELRRPAS